MLITNNHQGGATVRRTDGVTMNDKPRSNRSRATKGSAHFRAFQGRVTMEPVDRNNWQIELDGAPTELVVTRVRENHWVVSVTSGRLVARNCLSATEAERVAAHHLFSTQPRPESGP
jgi:hypothetical protein